MISRWTVSKWRHGRMKVQTHTCIRTDGRAGRLVTEICEGGGAEYMRSATMATMTRKHVVFTGRDSKVRWCGERGGGRRCESLGSRWRSKVALARVLCVLNNCALAALTTTKTNAMSPRRRLVNGWHCSLATRCATLYECWIVDTSTYCLTYSVNTLCTTACKLQNIYKIW